jgi:hypothetical protein
MKAAGNIKNYCPPDGTASANAPLAYKAADSLGLYAQAGNRKKSKGERR